MLKKNLVKRPRGGHFPGHLRDAFILAIEAYMSWNDEEPEPKVEVSVNYEPTPFRISEVCKILWNCTDILPNLWYRELTDNAIWPSEGPGSQTYAAAARYMLAEIERINALPTPEVKHEELHTDTSGLDLAFVL